MNKLSENYALAYAFATERHAKQFRKGVKVPYIVHIYEVAQYLRESGADEETIIAGILHDTVEDTGTKLEEIKEKFGDKVAMLVDYCTEIKSMPYLERKREHDNRLAHAPKDAKLIKCADCLSNLRSLYLDTLYNDEIWKVFNSTRENIKTHYKWSIEAFSELQGLKIYQDLKNYFDLTFKD